MSTSTSTDDSSRTLELAMHAAEDGDASALHQGEGLGQSSPITDSSENQEGREGQGEGDTDDENTEEATQVAGRLLSRSGALLDVLNPSHAELAIASMVRKHRFFGDAYMRGHQIPLDYRQRTGLPVPHAPAVSGTDLHNDPHHVDTSKSLIAQPREVGLLPRSLMEDPSFPPSSGALTCGDILGDHREHTVNGRRRDSLTFVETSPAPFSPSGAELDTSIAQPDVVIQTSHHAAKIAKSLSRFSM
ncbi:unnamed protein product [Peniophora sp. CBMAI 1063]|nr:unnamed protein product [Peniophora sp. CBMAI 1063]